MTQRQASLFDFEDTGTSQYGYKFGVAAEAGDHIAEARKMARRTDPVTSQIAAASTAWQLSKLEQRFMDAMKTIHYEPTAREVANKAYPIESAEEIRQVFTQRETLRKRAGELCNPKYSVDKTTGEKTMIRPAMIRIAGERICEETGNLASTYAIAQP